MYLSWWKFNQFQPIIFSMNEPIYILNEWNEMCLENKKMMWKRIVNDWIELNYSKCQPDIPILIGFFFFFFSKKPTKWMARNR